LDPPALNLFERKATCAWGRGRTDVAHAHRIFLIDGHKA
jgi:hypothetical protein